jgi:hypothetical protein
MYNRANRLMTHPLEDLLAQVRARSLSGCAPISDIYVIAHGWNYQVIEAVAQYHNYIAMVDSGMSPDKTSGRTSIQQTCDGHFPRFQPYFIFVAWTSASRPFGDLASAAFPSGLDDSVSLITSLTDGVVLFLPSVWKQSLNSSLVAMGDQEADTYLTRVKDTSSSQFSTHQNPDHDMRDNCLNLSLRQDEAYGTNAQDMRSAGIDTPLSLVLSELAEWNETNFNGCGTRAKIHLVGHSFGAKLLTLATLQAQWHWTFNTILNEEMKKGEESKDLPRNERINQSRRRLADIGQEDFTQRFAQAALRSGRTQKPFESLLLFNPAMNPREIRTRSPLSSTEGLKLIPRKAIIYTNYDYPNGLFFDTSQIILNNSWSYLSHRMIVRYRELFLRLSPLRLLDSNGKASNIKGISAPLRLLWDVSYAPVYGTYMLGWGVVTGSLTWSLSKIGDLPSDLIYHIKNHDTFDRNGSSFVEFFRQSFNAVHFFTPIPLLRRGVPTDQLGIWRHTIPAIGRTGLNRLAAGRGIKEIRPLDEFVDLDDNTTEIDSMTFCRLSAKLLDGHYPLPEHLRTIPALRADRIYSFDGSLIFDGGGWFAQVIDPRGAHGDLASSDLPSNSCSPRADSLLGHDHVPQKRNYAFNFVFNFTQILGVDHSVGSNDNESP